MPKECNSAIADVGSQGVRRLVWIGHLPLAGNPGGTAAFQIGELTPSTHSKLSPLWSNFPQSRQTNPPRHPDTRHLPAQLQRIQYT